MTDEGEPQRRLVVLTGNGPEHHYVADRLATALPVHRVVVDVAERSPSLRRAFRGSVLGGVSRMGVFAVRRLVRDKAARAAAFDALIGSSAQFAHPELMIPVHGVNSDDALAAVAAARPDMLLVFGTSIVGERMLSLPRYKSLNLHTGISPQYRGTDCAFWPVANREPQWLGATVHECTLDVDGGEIFGTAHTSWDVADGLHELFVRTVMCGAELYADVVLRYLPTGRLQGSAQDLSIGHEYRGYMRTLGPELRARVALRRGLLATPARSSLSEGDG